ncbi:adenylate and guanylate cyclase catalytic domain-containing protein [Chytriomyces cf. hyalinus JEL632]|nr:adenylate and guanylate cyclase catalytic domain-containing protein [Chytriomyces cf. hyalinus JEL632]
MKNHEEEIRQLKAEQENSMKELMESQLTTDDKDTEKKASQIHHGVILPAHIVERIEAGQPVVPEQFKCVTVFFTEIYGFKNLVATIDPVKMIHVLDKMYKQFDQIISKFSQIFKVESVSHTYMLASGLSASGSESEVSECAHQALTCANALKDWVAKTDFSSIVGNVDIKLCIGIHSGPASGALIATKVGRYCLFGETVQLASRMCATAESNKIQVSPMTIQVLGLDDNFEFAERGDIDIQTQGKSKMCTYWLLSDEDDM